MLAASTVFVGSSLHGCIVAGAYAVTWGGLDCLPPAQTAQLAQRIISA